MQEHAPEMPDAVEQALLDAILPHVPFDGWSEPAFCAAVQDTGIEPTRARTVCARGALDLAVVYHRAGDRALRDLLAATDLTDLKIREKIALAVKMRIEISDDREVVRRASALFSLPHNAPEGARLIWETADAIWNALGDPSQDFNWYSKRATLSGVYGATLLFWLGDDSANSADSWEFLNRRIENVMQIEKVKAQMRAMPLIGAVVVGPAERMLSKLQAPNCRNQQPDNPSSPENI